MEKVEYLKDFIDFIQNPPEEDKIEKLEDHLIKLYDIGLNIEYRQGKSPKPKSNYADLRVIVTQNFNELGPYNDVLEVKENLGKTELVTGDSIDDLTDIVKDITDALTLRKEKDILAVIKMDFEFHTKSHILNLLRFIANDI